MIKGSWNFYSVSSLDGNLTYHTQIVPDSTANDKARAFGQSFALDGNRLVVGAKEAYWNSMYYTGAAYLFDFNGSSFFQVARFLYELLPPPFLLPSSCLLFASSQLHFSRR